jgi:hypothetical protein
MSPLVIVKELPMTGLRRMIAALAVAAMLFSEGGVARAAVNHHAPKASLPACVLGKQIMAGVSKGWTQFGQVSGANFALTNRSTACAVKGTLWAQLHGPKGGAIGPMAAVRYIRNHVIRETFQLVSQVYFSYTYPCDKRLTATRVRIGLDGSAVAVTLRTPETVCVSRHLSVSVVTPAFPIPPRCKMGQLNVHLGGTQGEAGSLVTPIVVENVSGAACTVSGFPQVQGADGPGGDLVGPPAREITPNGSGTPVKNLNHTGASASSVYVQAETTNYDPGRCGPKAARGINVALQGTSAEYLPDQVSMCSKLNSTSVTRIGVYL